MNPYDVDRMAARIREALLMPAMERRSRMRALRLRVMSHDAERWAESFVDAMQAIQRRQQAQVIVPAEDPFALAQRVGHESRLLLILDYDGTLMPFAPTPDAAQPDDELLELLESLAKRASTHGARRHRPLAPVDRALARRICPLACTPSTDSGRGYGRTSPGRCCVRCRLG